MQNTHQASEGPAAGHLDTDSEEQYIGSLDDQGNVFHGQSDAVPEDESNCDWGLDLPPLAIQSQLSNRLGADCRCQLPMPMGECTMQLAQLIISYGSFLT